MQPAELSGASGSALAASSVVYSAFGSVQSGSVASASSVVYTAFGERIAGSMPTDGTRYGYAGEWGYQTHADFPFLHVGHRYYDPSTGRFMQRDPIGIAGGLNVYKYLAGSPSSSVDPFGLVDWERVGAVTGGGGIGGGAGVAIGIAVCIAFSIPTGGVGGMILIGVMGGAGAGAGSMIADEVYQESKGKDSVHTPPRDDRRGPRDEPSNCCIHNGSCDGHGRVPINRPKRSDEPDPLDRLRRELAPGVNP